MSRPVRAVKVLEAMAQAGIIDVDDHIRRVIIDLDVSEVAKIYVERYGDDRLLGLALNLHGGYVISYDSGVKT